MPFKTNENKIKTHKIAAMLFGYLSVFIFNSQF